MSAVSQASRGPITIGIMLATVMSALDTTIVNVALPHMLASLSASPEQITWVITSYIVAQAVAMPLSGWLAARLGLKTMLLISLGGFTAASVLCGLATSLPEMVLFRILQGLLAASLGPLGQTVLLNINPPERFGRAMALVTMGGVVAPVLGPVVGGYLTDDLSWRWCFYINVPTGIAAILLLWLFLPRETTNARRFDFLGYGSLALGIAAFQLLLDRGPTLDWFSAREIWIEAILAAGGLWVYVTHTLTAEHPLFDPALARDRNFVSSTVFGFFFTFVLYCSLTLLPIMMQGVLGYSVMHAGVISMPRGLIMLLVLQVMGRVDALLDRRLLVAIGLGFLVFSFWRMSQFDLSMTGESIVWATMIQGLGQGIIFVPLSTLGYATISPALRPDASAISNLMRNIGGSGGIAMVQALTAANIQRMHASLAAHIRLDDPVVRAALPSFLSPDSVQGAVALNAEITRQATMVAYVDDFRLMVFITLLCLPLVLLLRQPRRRVIATEETAPLEIHA
jgi:DHA2 family multidrug resistance protein